MFKYTALCLILLIIIWESANAGCSRDDVDYYLSKGFTQKQITAICDSGSTQTYQPYGSNEKSKDKEEERIEKIEDDIKTLERSIKAWDVNLTPKKLEYTRKFCVAIGTSPEVTDRLRSCPDVRYRIYFKDLKVIGHKRKYYLFGTREILVEGKVKRKLLDDFKDYPIGQQRQLLAAYKSNIRKDGTSIPLRKDVPTGRVEIILKQYVKTASRGNNN